MLTVVYMSKAPEKYNLLTSRLTYETFIQIVCYREGATTVREIAEATKRTRAVVSEQIRTLKRHNLVTERIEGREKYFTANEDGLIKLLKRPNPKNIKAFMWLVPSLCRNFAQLIEMSKKFEWNKPMPTEPPQILWEAIKDAYFKR